MKINYQKGMKNGKKLLRSMNKGEIINIEKLGNIRCLASRLKSEGFEFKIKINLRGGWDIKRVK